MNFCFTMNGQTAQNVPRIERHKSVRILFLVAKTFIGTSIGYITGTQSFPGLKVMKRLLSFRLMSEMGLEVTRWPWEFASIFSFAQIELGTLWD